MQSYEAQGPIIKGKQQSVRVYCENLQYNNDTLRSNFSGTAFPENPVVGQHCYREDAKIEYIYTDEGWIEVGGAQGEIAKELNGARGSHDSLTARLDVALNPDGTLKANAEINLDEWKALDVPVAFIDRRRFGVVGDVSALFTANRAIKLEDGVSPRITYVEKAYYNKVDDATTVTCRDSVVSEKTNKVKIGFLQNSLPANVAYKEDIKANQPETTCFKSHVASGLDININPRDGHAKITKGRAYVNGTYEDLDKDVNLAMEDIQEGKHLVYAQKKSDGGLAIKTKRFESPVLYDQIKNIPADDLLFMTDWEVEDEADARNLIKDKTGNGCHLQPQGTLANIKTATPISWKVPVYDLGCQDIFWKSADKAFKGLPGNKPWSIIHSFIPRATFGATPIPMIVTMAGGVTQIDFRLHYTDSNTETYTAGCSVTGANSLAFSLNNAATATQQHTTACQVKRNKPCLLALEFDGETISFYINGKLTQRANINKNLAASTDGTIWFNQYSGNTFGVNDTNLFTCVRSGVWGEKAICEICNQMGIPTEHMGYNMKTPEMFHNMPEGAFSDGFHAWMMDERAGNVVYDINKTYPLNGVTSNSRRVLSTAKSDGRTSINTSASGAIEFDRVAVGEKFSFFAYLTPRANGTIASNYPTDNSGWILSIDAGGVIKAHIGKAWIGGTTRITLGEPVLVGMVIEGNMLKLYADSMNPQIIPITDETGLHDNNRLVMGYHGANSAHLNSSDFHAAVMADRAFNDAEVRELFKSFKHQEYKYIADDNNISSQDAVLGMIKVNDKAEVEQIETYPRWSRHQNPFKSDKYFIGWYTINAANAAKAAQRYYIPNLYGSSRVKVNFYAKQCDGTQDVTTMSPEAAQQWTDFATFVGGLSELHVNKDYIGFSIAYSPLMQQRGGNPFYMGIEVEPMAEGNEIDSLSF